MEFKDYEDLIKSLADLSYKLRLNWEATDDDLGETFENIQVETDYLLDLIERTNLASRNRLIFSYRLADLERDMRDNGIPLTDKHIDSCADYLVGKTDTDGSHHDICLHIQDWNENRKELLMGDSNND